MPAQGFGMTIVIPEPVFEVIPARSADLGEGMLMRRLLPSRGRRTVGAWCFMDHFGPTPTGGMRVGPHPHMGMQSLTWLFEGEVTHTDSLGNQQLIRPGHLNLMRAGSGVAHAELTPEAHRGSFHGIQLWIAQPDWARHSSPAFDHFASLPHLMLGDAQALVFMGSVEGLTSPAYAETPLVGAELLLAPRGVSRVPLNRKFENALAVIQGSVVVNGKEILAGSIAYLGGGRDSIVIKTYAGSRLILLGGEPFDEQLFMWWNFIGRNRDEIELAAKEWNTGSHFGEVPEMGLPRILAPDFPWRAAQPA
jgi:redox-sensitive bicupin YhaK (pirin superfamily)